MEGFCCLQSRRIRGSPEGRRGSPYLTPCSPKRHSPHARPGHRQHHMQTDRRCSFPLRIAAGVGREACACASCSCGLGYETGTETKGGGRREKWSHHHHHGCGFVAQGLKTNGWVKMEAGEKRSHPRDGNDAFRVRERGCHYHEIGVVM